MELVENTGDALLGELGPLCPMTDQDPSFDVAPSFFPSTAANAAHKAAGYGSGPFNSYNPAAMRAGDSPSASGPFAMSFSAERFAHKRHRSEPEERSRIAVAAAAAADDSETGLPLRKKPRLVFERIALLEHDELEALRAVLESLESVKRAAGDDDTPITKYLDMQTFLAFYVTSIRECTLAKMEAVLLSITGVFVSGVRVSLQHGRVEVDCHKRKPELEEVKSVLRLPADYLTRRGADLAALKEPEPKWLVDHCDELKLETHDRRMIHALHRAVVRYFEQCVDAADIVAECPQPKCLISHELSPGGPLLLEWEGLPHASLSLMRDMQDMLQFHVTEVGATFGKKRLWVRLQPYSQAARVARPHKEEWVLVR